MKPRWQGKFKMIKAGQNLDEGDRAIQNGDGPIETSSEEQDEQRMGRHRLKGLGRAGTSALARYMRFSGLAVLEERPLTQLQQTRGPAKAKTLQMKGAPMSYHQCLLKDEPRSKAPCAYRPVVVAIVSLPPGARELGLG